jgi:C4-dicarboxylate transporter DctM subunit
MACTAAGAAFEPLGGSDMAADAALLPVPLPEMRRFGYKDELSLGAIACGANLGFIIPPSGAFVIYGLVTQESIGKLFLAAPGGLFYGHLRSNPVYLAHLFPLSDQFGV